MTTTTPTPRRLVEDFYAAYAKRDLEVLETYLDDEVDWSVVGPIDVIHFCGQRRGKAAVMDFFRRAVPEVIDSFDAAEQMLGHAIDLHLDTNADSPWAGNLVAV